ncbi:hypothetical protein [Microcoleus sp. D3_18_C4]|uniref:hypothetical protein n=1 Tax=Microcoleus sp. D3_18_C4 TaxID=3055335 RepID=UPI002FD287C9
MTLDPLLRKLAAINQALSALSAETCTTPGCNQAVSKPGHKLCYEHWKANNAQPVSAPKPTPQLSSSPSLLSATSISDKLVQLGVNTQTIKQPRLYPCMST